MFTQAPTRRVLRRAARAVDAFAAPHGIDRYVEQVVPTWSSTEVRGRIVAVDRSAEGSIALTVKPNGNWTGFRAGQYTQVTVEIDGVRHTRCYSMASAATDDRTFQLGIRAHPDGLVSQYLHDHAEPGMVVGLTPAAGEFHLPDTRPDRLLLVSGGSGITPVLSMLRTLCAEGHEAPVTFLHYARSADSVLFADVLRAIDDGFPNVRVATVLDDGSSELRGLFGEDHLVAVEPAWREAEVYVCGPAPLMDSVRDLYDEAGVADRFHQEAFTLKSFVGEAGDVGGSLRLTRSDVDVESDGRPILEQAEAAGLDPDHGCRMGICHTCTRSLTSGCVRDAVTGELTSATPTESSVDIRVCVSVPVGDIEIDL